MVEKAYKYRFYPTQAQENLLRRTMGCVRKVYNLALAARTEAWYERQERVQYKETSSLLTNWKKTEDLDFLNEVSCVPLQQCLRHLQKAFANFWGKRAKYPRFKAKRNGGSAEFTKSAFKYRDGKPRQLSGRGVFLWGVIMGTIFKQDGQTRFMSISDFDSHRVDNLFLLVGENPLPNYVAARLLLKKGGTPYLVYTTDTEKQADRLQTILSNESMGLNSAQRVPLEEYDADAYHIQKRIRDRLETIENGTIGLNYTGGTKAMAVHAYRAVFSKESPEIVFSYLDPRRLEMCIDREHQERVSIKVQPETLPVQLQDIFQIHGLELTNEPAREAKLPELALVLAGIFQDKRKESQWFDWYHNIFCTEARNKKKDESWGNWKSDSKLKLLSIYLENLPLEVIEYFKQQEWVTPNDKLSLQAVQQKGGFAKTQTFL